MQSFDLTSTKAERWFYGFLSAALVSCVVEDVICGIWKIHTGQYFPWRHVPIVPLYPAPVLLIEWGFLFLSAWMIALGKNRRLGSLIGAVTLLVSLTQRYSNHRSLIVIVLIYLAVSSAKHLRFAYQMIRYQLILVYLFSALAKIDAGFLSGETLSAIGHNVRGAMLPDSWVRAILMSSASRPLAWLTVVAELGMPILLLKAPMVGFGLVLLLHCSFSLMMPAIWPFTFVMIAMAALFLRDFQAVE